MLEQRSCDEVAVAAAAETMFAAGVVVSASFSWLLLMIFWYSVQAICLLLGIVRLATISVNRGPTYLALRIEDRFCDQGSLRSV